MSDLFGNHIVGFPTRWLIFWHFKQSVLSSAWFVFITFIMIVTEAAHCTVIVIFLFYILHSPVQVNSWTIPKWYFFVTCKLSESVFELFNILFCELRSVCQMYLMNPLYVI